MIPAMSFLAFGAASFVVALVPSVPSRGASVSIRLSRSSAKIVRDVAASSAGNMARGVFGWSKNRGSSKVTGAAIEMERLVRLAASPMIPGEQVPHAIARAARRIGIDRGRVQSFWYGKARNCTPDELEAARVVAVEHAQDMELLRDEHRRALAIWRGLRRVLPSRLRAMVDPVRNGTGGADRAGSPLSVRRGDAR